MNAYVVSRVAGTTALMIDNSINRGIIDFGRVTVGGLSNQTYAITQSAIRGVDATLMTGAQTFKSAQDVREGFGIAAVASRVIDSFTVENVNDAAKFTASTLVGMGATAMSIPGWTTGVGAVYGVTFGVVAGNVTSDVWDQQITPRVISYFSTPAADLQVKATLNPSETQNLLNRHPAPLATALTAQAIPTFAEDVAQRKAAAAAASAAVLAAQQAAAALAAAQAAQAERASRGLTQTTVGGDGVTYYGTPENPYAYTANESAMRDSSRSWSSSSDATHGDSASADTSTGSMCRASDYSSSTDTNTDSIGGFWPIVIDLNGDGVKLQTLGNSTARFDADDDGYRESTAWASNQDGILMIDEGGDGLVTQAKEIAFANWTTEADTDLQALAKTFDSNKDGVLDAQDARFADFKIWRDANGDGVQTSVAANSVALCALFVRAAEQFCVKNSANQPVYRAIA